MIQILYRELTEISNIHFNNQMLPDGDYKTTVEVNWGTVRGSNPVILVLLLALLGQVLKERFAPSVKMLFFLMSSLCLKWRRHPGKQARMTFTELQIRGGIKDNSKIFFISQRKHML